MCHLGYMHCPFDWQGKLCHKDHLAFSSQNTVCLPCWSTILAAKTMALWTVMPAQSGHTQGCLFPPSDFFALCLRSCSCNFVVNYIWELNFASGLFFS